MKTLPKPGVNPSIHNHFNRDVFVIFALALFIAILIVCAGIFVYYQF